MFWVFPVDPESYPIPAVEPLSKDSATAGPPPADPAFQPLGHFSLDWEDTRDDPEPSLASKEEGNLLLGSLFLLKSQQGRGLGK